VLGALPPFGRRQRVVWVNLTLEPFEDLVAAGLGACLPVGGSTPGHVRGDALVDVGVLARVGVRGGPPFPSPAPVEACR